MNDKLIAIGKEGLKDIRKGTSIQDAIELIKLKYVLTKDELYMIHMYIIGGTILC